MAVAAPGLQKLSQFDFSAGAFPGAGEGISASTGMDRIPPNGCADIVNGLIDEDGSIFRRGGSQYLGTLAATDVQPFRSLWSGYLGTVGGVTVVSKLGDTPITHQKVYAMFAADTDFAFRFNMLSNIGPQRPLSFGGMLLFVGPATYPGAGVNLDAWGGSTKTDGTGNVTGQSVTLTKGSKTMTGSGTTFTSAEPGMIVRNSTTDVLAPIESIESNTSLTLLRPWPGATVSYTVDIVVNAAPTVAETALPATLTGDVYASMIVGRLVLARGNRVAFTGDPFSVDVNDYHELPVGAAVVGLEPLRDQLLVFSTQGVFVISNMAFNLTDALGNPQQRLERVAPDVVLWDNLGVANWRGSVIAPCVDDVYLIDSAASMRPIAGGMSALYRSYVRQGFQTGQATVYRGHYILPILNAGAWYDTLVCNLRTGAWTRWADYGGTVRGLASKVGDTTRQPQLMALGASGTTPRVLDLSGAFTPTATVKSEADGSVHRLRVNTRTFDFGDLVSRQWRRVRLRYELRDASSDDPFLDAGSEAGRLSLALESYADHGPEGEQVYTWRVSRRSRGIRFQFTQWNATSGARIRGIEVFVRPSGRR